MTRVERETERWGKDSERVAGQGWGTTPGSCASAFLAPQVWDRCTMGDLNSIPLALETPPSHLSYLLHSSYWLRNPPEHEEAL